MIKKHLRLSCYLRPFPIFPMLITISIVAGIYTDTVNADNEGSSGTSADQICKLLPGCENNADADADAKVTDVQKASYALGVKFQRDIIEKFGKDKMGKYKMEYRYFIRGVRDAEASEVTQDSAVLNESLASVIISKSDKSKIFLKEFIASDDVVAVKGIYAIKGDKNIQSGNDLLPDCKTKNGSANDFRVAYTRLWLDSMERVEWEDEATQTGCINVSESEVIRGWRTALNAMEKGQVWEVVIPPELGYGSAGLNSPDGNTVLVDPDVNLRFMLKVISKP